MRTPGVVLIISFFAFSFPSLLICFLHQSSSTHIRMSTSHVKKDTSLRSDYGRLAPLVCVRLLLRQGYFRVLWDKNCGPCQSIANSRHPIQPSLRLVLLLFISNDQFETERPTSPRFFFEFEHMYPRVTWIFHLAGAARSYWASMLPLGTASKVCFYEPGVAAGINLVLPQNC